MENGQRDPDTPVVRRRPQSAAELGVRIGALSSDRRVTSDNWIDPPFNRWGYSHVRELSRTARVWRGAGPVWQLPERPLGLERFVVQHDGQHYSYMEMLHATYTDAAVVVHDGNVVCEYYDQGIRPDDTHLLMSVSKSLTATLVGVLVGDGVLSTHDLVTDHLPQLVGTAWDGCTVQHLLDMRAGTAFSEDDMDDPDSDGRLIEQVSGYTTHRRPDLPADTYEWIRSVVNDGPHGGAFRYRSILTDVLGWIVVERTGEAFHDLFASRLWSRLGMEHDADLIVDGAGFPAVEGGLCATARDLARFGLMHLQRGRVGGEQLVPAGWIDRVTQFDQELVAAYAAGPEADPSSLRSCYHDCWWVHDAEAGRYGGYGLGGQTLLVDRPSSTVVVKLSSWPKRMDPQLLEFADAANHQLFDMLAAAQARP